MRIISDFHDYYDIGMQSGVDPQLPYMRFRREEEITLYGRGFFNSSYFDDYCAGKYNLLFIGFAGKIYPTFEYANDLNEKVYIFDLDEIPLKYFEHIIGDAIENCGRSKSYKRESQQLLVRLKNDIEIMWAYKDHQYLLDLFDRFKTAIFIYYLEGETVIINERLNQYNFQKVLPPMQAFQELAMYVGSYLTKLVIEEPPLSDKVKAEIHGFDKFSFRKAKQK